MPRNHRARGQAVDAGRYRFNEAEARASESRCAGISRAIPLRRFNEAEARASESLPRRCLPRSFPTRLQ